MNSVTIFKWPLIIAIAGIIIRVLGTMMKLLHWRGADINILVGTLIIIAGCSYAIALLLRLPPSPRK